MDTMSNLVDLDTFRRKKKIEQKNKVRSALSPKNLDNISADFKKRMALVEESIKKIKMLTEELKKMTIREEENDKPDRSR